VKKSLDQRDLFAVFEGSSNPVCIVRPVRRRGRIVDLRLLAYNPAFARVTKVKGRGRGEEAFISEASAEDFNAIVQLSAEALEAHRPKAMKLYLASCSRWFRCTFAPSDSGNIVVVLTREVTDAAARKTQRPASIFGTFFESGGAKMILRRSDGRILECNRAAADFYGRSRRELKALSILDLDISPPQVIRRTMDSIDARGLLIFRTCHRAAKGEEKDVEVHSYLGEFAGETVHFSVVLDRSESACRPIPDLDPAPLDRNRPVEERHFDPFVERYERDLPFVKELVRQVVPYGRMILYRRGDHFLEYGDISPNVGLVLGGLFRQYTISPDGADCTLKLLRAGDILYVVPPRSGKSSSPRLALEAMGECRVFVVGSRYFGPLIDRDVRWSKLFYLAALEAVAAHTEREYSLISEDATARFLRFVEVEKDAIPLLRSYHVASYLGITSETLSRIRRARRS